MERRIVSRGFHIRAGVSKLFLQRASYEFKNVARAAYKKLMMIQTLNDELKLSLF